MIKKILLVFIAALMVVLGTNVVHAYGSKQPLIHGYQQSAVLQIAGKNRQTIYTCKCKARYTKKENPPEHCPIFVYGTSSTRGGAQKNAKLTAPQECRLFYGHCDCQKSEK